MKRSAVLFAALGLGLAAPTSASAAGIEIGWLDCTVGKSPRLEFITSSRVVVCKYTKKGRRGSPETYVGIIDKVGLNLGKTGNKILAWKVIQYEKSPYHYGSLVGTYRGVSAEVTAAAGVGVNVLGGGSGHNYILQPVSIQAQTGLNVAAHITRFRLINR